MNKFIYRTRAGSVEIHYTFHDTDAEAALARGAKLKRSIEVPFELEYRMKDEHFQLPLTADGEIEQ